ncbi:hypothetical protein AAZX31_01G139500 [Glycine max]
MFYAVHSPTLQHYAPPLQQRSAQVEHLQKLLALLQQSRGFPG